MSHSAVVVVLVLVDRPPPFSPSAETTALRQHQGRAPPTIHHVNHVTMQCRARGVSPEGGGLHDDVTPAVPTLLRLKALH